MTTDASPPSESPMKLMRRTIEWNKIGRSGSLSWDLTMSIGNSEVTQGDEILWHAQFGGWVDPYGPQRMFYFANATGVSMRQAVNACFRKAMETRSPK